MSSLGAGPSQSPDSQQQQQRVSSDSSEEQDRETTTRQTMTRSRHEGGMASSSSHAGVAHAASLPMPSRRIGGDGHASAGEDGSQPADAQRRQQAQHMQPPPRRASSSGATMTQSSASHSLLPSTAAAASAGSVGVAGLASPHRNLTRFLHTELGESVMLNRLRSGGIFLKHGSRSAPHFRFVCCSGDLTRVTWTDLKSKKMKSQAQAQGTGGELPPPSSSSSSTSFVLSDSILAVTGGHATRVLRERAAQLKDSDPNRCLSLTTTLRTLDLECVSEQERDLWMLTFAFLIDYTQKKRAAKIKRQQRQEQQMQQSLPSASQPAATDASDAMVPPSGRSPSQLDGVVHGDVSLVHALRLLCDRSIGRAHDQQQPQAQTTTIHTDTGAADPASHHQTEDVAVTAAVSQAKSPGTPQQMRADSTHDTNEVRSLLQSPRAVDADGWTEEGQRMHGQAVPAAAAAAAVAAAAPASKDPLHPSKVDPAAPFAPQTLDSQTREIHENDATLRSEGGAASLPAAIIVPGSEDKAQQPAQQAAHAARPFDSAAFLPQPLLLPTPPNPRHEHGEGGAVMPLSLAVPAADAPPGVGVGAAPLLRLASPSPESLLLASRERLARELEAAREANRSLYIHSARKMIQLQHKIDSLTRENIDLIRSLTPLHTQG